MPINEQFTPLPDLEPSHVVIIGEQGTTRYVYALVARRGIAHSKASAPIVVSNGFAQLSQANVISVRFLQIPGYTEYDLYRLEGGATQGLIVSGAPLVVPTGQERRFRDIGEAGDGTLPPNTNTTGLWLPYTCWNTATNRPEPNDLAHHTILLSGDGQDPVPMANNQHPTLHKDQGNGEYVIQCTLDEVQALTLALSGHSNDNTKAIVPTRFKF